MTFPARSGFRAMCAACVLSATVAGCSWIERIIGPIIDHLTNVEDILTSAIVDVNANSANWQQILQQAIDKVPDTQRQVKQDLQELMQRAIANAGLELRCNVQYMGDMVADGLGRILAEARHQTPPPEEAVICDASPDAIDMNLDPNNRNVVELTGYNLDLGGIKLFHVTQSGETDETANLATVSPFKRVANLGSSGVVLGPTSVMLRVALPQGGSREITVIQKIPKICETRDFQVPSATIQVIPPKVGVGDDDFDGHGACVQAIARISMAADRKTINGTVFADMYECPDNLAYKRSDYTQARGSVSRAVFTAPHDEELAQVLGPSVATFAFVSDGHYVQSVSDSGLVVKWDVLGDTDGADIGKTWVRAIFNSIHVVLRKTGDCVPPDQLARLIQRSAASKPLRDFLKRERPEILERARSLPAIPPHSLQGHTLPR